MITEPRSGHLVYRGGFPVYPSRYVVLGGASRRVAVRFFNGSGVGVTGVRFRLVQKNEGGEPIGEQIAAFDGLFAENGKEFAIPDIPVDFDCDSVEIELLAVYSDAYEYLFEGGGVRLNYGHTPLVKGNEVSFEPKPTYSVSKKRKKYVMFAFLAVFLLAAVAGGLAFWFGFFGQAERVTPPAEFAQTAQVRSVTDAETL